MQSWLFGILLLSILLAASASVILSTLNKFGMRVAAKVFSAAVLVVSFLIPLYAAQIILQGRYNTELLENIPIYIFSRCVTNLAVVCRIFGYLAHVMGAASLFVLVGLTIVAFKLVRMVVSALKRVPDYFCKKPNTLQLFFAAWYIPNYQGTFLILGHLLN